MTDGREAEPDAPSDTGRTAPAGYSCPDCGAETINGQGVYTCAECDWDATAPGDSDDPVPDDPISSV
jgi:ribosomal protein L37AE/L43A